MEVKSEISPFDLSKICRACLGEKNDLRSVFLSVENTNLGQSMVLAEMMMGFTNIEVKCDDGLPSSVCLQCMHNISTAYAFKQLCEQSDSNLRQYLGKPLNGSCKEENSQQTDYSNILFFDSLDFYSSSEESEPMDEFKDEFSILPSFSNNTSDEKIIAQKQLLKASKSQKNKNSKKKLLKVGAKAGVGGLSKKCKKNNNQCNVCKKQFINLKSFRKHLRTHIEDRPFKCTLCPRGFTEENYLNNHMRTHVPDDQKPHECEVCKKRFIHVTLLNKHMLKHSGEKPFVCKICNKGCYAENSLLKHMKIHEKKEGDPGLLKHICDYCKTEFPDPQSLSIHIKQHSGDRPFVCNMCGKCFPQRFNLELHLRTHTGERPFKCEICKNGYVSKASLKIHMRTHTNERPFACDFCGKAFRQSGDLTSHKRLHGTEKPIECSVCQKRFTTVMKLKYHMRNHTGERPYVCTICGRGFTVNTILLRHMRVHSGERPYVCVTCGKAFSQSSTLNTHMKTHISSPKSNQETESRMPKYQNPTNIEPKYSIVPHQSTLQMPLNPNHNRLMEQNNQLLQNEATRMIQPESSRMIAPDSTRLLNDTAHLLADTRLIGDNSNLLTTEGRRVLINVAEPIRLLVNENNRIPDHRILPSDNRILNNINIDTTDQDIPTENRLLNNDSNRNLSIIESNRVLTNKYISNYDPYQRGHL